MLARLRPWPLVGGNDQEQEFHARGTREHIVQKAFVAGNVDNARFNAVIEAQMREAQIERHATQTLFDPAIGIGAGERAHQRRLAVVDVAGGADNVHLRHAE